MYLMRPYSPLTNKPQYDAFEFENNMIIIIFYYNCCCYKMRNDRFHTGVKAYEQWRRQNLIFGRAYAKVSGHFHVGSYSIHFL